MSEPRMVPVPVELIENLESLREVVEKRLVAVEGRIRYLDDRDRALIYLQKYIGDLKMDYAEPFDQRLNVCEAELSELSEIDADLERLRQELSQLRADFEEFKSCSSSREESSRRPATLRPDS
jgi:DNA repair exonuclease SbcCD ATPase subunit